MSVLQIHLISMKSYIGENLNLQLSFILVCISATEPPFYTQPKLNVVLVSEMIYHTMKIEYYLNANLVKIYTFHITLLCGILNKI
jgi:hypothetical protein